MSGNLTLRSRQKNPCDHLFWKSRGYPCRPKDWRDELYRIGYYDNNNDQYSDNTEDRSDVYDEEDYPSEYSTDEDQESYHSNSSEERRQQNNLRSRQNNPCDQLFWTSKGYPCRPSDWEDELYRIGYYDNDENECYSGDNESYCSSEDYASEYPTDDDQENDYQDDYSNDDSADDNDDQYSGESEDYEQDYASESISEYSIDDDQESYYSSDDSEEQRRQENNLRSRQMNPCDQLFWTSRGYPCRPKDWRDELYRIGYYDNNNDQYSDYSEDRSADYNEEDYPSEYSTDDDQEGNSVDHSTELKQEQNNSPRNLPSGDHWTNSASGISTEIDQRLNRRDNLYSSVVKNNQTASAAGDQERNNFLNPKMNIVNASYSTVAKTIQKQNFIHLSSAAA